ncbi:MAG: MBL fold metallo-hydrolase [Thermoplasmata archaeon]|nr:MBL fold metallo-hydrolase [Thermoplasmata archaeon]
MYIKYHGHACFEIGNNKKIVFDPHDGTSIGLPKPDPVADAVFITHEHFDHNAINVVKGKFSIVREANSGIVNGIKYDAVTQYHDDLKGKKRGEVKIYKVFLDGLSFTHVGDLGHIPDEKALDLIKGSDFLFLPVGSVYTIDGNQAAEIVKITRPRVAVPMHFYIPGSELKLEKIDKFISHFDKNQIKEVGKIKEFSKDDLKNNTEIWVFSV